MKSVVYQHAYVADGIPDHKGHDRCALCGLPKERGVHELPVQARDVTHLEERKLGEAHGVRGTVNGHTVQGTKPCPAGGEPYSAWTVCELVA